MPPGAARAAASGEPPAGRSGIDWEGFVGVKLFSWIAGLALALAAVLFIRYSVESGWLQPPVRLAIGIVVGMGLLIGCELKMARKYSQTANALDAAGIAILFSSFYAAHALWRLIPAMASFGLLAIVTALAAVLSIRRQSLFIAVLGLLGGFATPALLSSGSNNPIGLFAYLLILNAGLAWIAYRRDWPLLSALSFLFTTVYQWGWAVKFLTAGTVPIAVGVFLIFPVFSFVSLALGRRSSQADQGSSLFGKIARTSAVLPLVFALYLAVVPAYGARYGILFGFLFLIDAGLFAIAALRGPRRLHLLGAVVTVLVFTVWLNGSYTVNAWPGILAFIPLFVLFYLAAPLAWHVPAFAKRAVGEFTGLSSRAPFAAPLLLLAFPALIAIEPRAAAVALPFPVLFLLVLACATYAVVRREPLVYLIAAFFALVSETVWSVKYLAAANILSAVAMYAAFAVVYIGVPSIARRRGVPLEPRGVGGIPILAAIAILLALAAAPVADPSLWAVALLLATLTAGLCFEAAKDRLPVLMVAGSAIGWLVLARWWMSASLTVMLLPSLVVVAGFSLLVTGGNAWARHTVAGDREAADGFELAGFAGLAGHLFLLFVAAKASLSIPPWPMLGILLVLNLSVGAAALYSRSGRAHVAAAGMAAFVLAIWVVAADAAPWPLVAVLAAVGLAGLSFTWLPLARRMRLEASTFEAAAVVAAFSAQVVAIIASQRVGSPGLAILVGAHLVLLGSVLTLAGRPGWRSLPLGVLVPSLAAGFIWQSENPGSDFWALQLAFCGLIYLAFVAYPLVLGRRVGSAIEPYLAAVLASVGFFLQARSSLVAGGHASVIGILPVVQAGLVALLLRQLMRIEAPGARTLGRLALVAGAALGFVTVAIPLQLERNWITIAWALEGAALAWLYRRVPHRGLLVAVTGLFAVVFVRLALNPSVLTYEPRGTLRIWNWYLYTYMICSAAMLGGGWLLSRTNDIVKEGLPRLSALLPAGGTILLFLLLNIEIADFYAVGPTITFNFNAGLAQDLTYTLGWAAFAVVLLGAGIALGVRAARVASIGLLAIAVVKAFMHDLGRLGGLYRIGSFVGLAICLALVAVALQKFVMAPKEAR